MKLLESTSYTGNQTLTFKIKAENPEAKWSLHRPVCVHELLAVSTYLTYLTGLVAMPHLTDLLPPFHLLSSTSNPCISCSEKFKHFLFKQLFAVRSMFTEQMQNFYIEVRNTNRKYQLLTCTRTQHMQGCYVSCKRPKRLTTPYIVTPF